MARSADWRDDISGALTTGGTSTAYTLTTNASLSGNGLCPSSTTPPDGTMIGIRASVANGTAAGMTVDSCVSYPLQSPAGTALPAGTLIAATPYRMQFNLANLSWVIEGLTGNPYSVPLGGLLASTSTTVPNSNFILPAGQCISTTTYAAYWVQQGSPASGGCAGGQFAVIDLRGRVPAALDNLNGSAANRLTSSSTGCGTAFTSVGAVCANGTEGYALIAAQIPPINSSGNNTVSVATTVSNVVFGTLVTTGVAAGGTSVTLGTSGGIVAGAVGSQGVNSIGVTSTGTSGTAHPQIQPTIGVSYFLRVI